MSTGVIAEAERGAVRAMVFTHLGGLVVAPTVSALWERGALEPFTQGSRAVPFANVVERTHANAGYLRVALRLLASCGWLIEEADANGCRSYSLTAEGRIALTLAPALY